MLPLVTVWLTPSAEAGELVAARRQGRIGDQLVVARLQLLAVDDGDRDARDADAAAVDIRRHRHAGEHGVAGRRGDRRGAEREQRRAGAGGLAEVEAERLLRVQGAGDRRRHLADQAARIGDVVVLHPQETGDRAAGEEAVGEGARGRALLDPDLHLARVVAVGDGRERRRFRAEDELLRRRRERPRPTRRRPRPSSPGRSSTGRRSPGRAGRAACSARGRCPWPGRSCR